MFEMDQVKANVVFVPATEKCKFFMFFLRVCLNCDLSETCLLN